jgi:hypothetical protein
MTLLDERAGQVEPADLLIMAMVEWSPSEREQARRDQFLRSASTGRLV